METTKSQFIDLFTVPFKKAEFVLKSAVKIIPEYGLITFSFNLNFDLWFPNQHVLRQARSKSLKRENFHS